MAPDMAISPALQPVSPLPTPLRKTVDQGHPLVELHSPTSFLVCNP